MLDASFASGLADPNDTYCAAQGDVDGDGDQDLLVQDRMAPVRLYMNNAVGQPGRNWIKLDVKGRGANTRGIGTRLVAQVGARAVWREVAAGTDYKSQGSYRQHIGIGASQSLASLTVTFPSAGAMRAATRTLTGLAANAVWPIWPPERLGDADGDGVRGAGDRAVVAAAAGAALTPAAAVLDLDGDGVLAKSDVAEFDRVRCDLDGDGRTGAADLALLLSAWGAPRFDFDDDGATAAEDLLLLLEGWSAH